MRECKPCRLRLRHCRGWRIMLTLAELQHKRERHAARRRDIAPRHLRADAMRWRARKEAKPAPPEPKAQPIAAPERKSILSKAIRWITRRK